MVTGLTVQGVSFGYGDHHVLRDATLGTLEAGTVTALIGPNAAGKTTLLKCMAGLLPCGGTVALDGAEVRKLPLDRLTHQVVYLPQETVVPGVLTVFESVLLARQRTASWRVGDADLADVTDVLARLELQHLAKRYLNELSGGQRQMVSIAQALVRRPRVLLLDEPTSSLDLQHTLEVLHLVRRLAAEADTAVVVAVHDLNLAARFTDRVAVLAGGRVLAHGTPQQVLTPDLLRHVYGVEALVHAAHDGVPQITPLASVRAAERAAAG